MNIVFALLIAVIVFCGYLLVDKILADKKQKEIKAARLTPEGNYRPDGELDDGSTGLPNDPSPGAQALAKLLRSLGVNVDESIRKLSKRFVQAGINDPDAPIKYLFFQRVVSLGLVILALLFISSPGEGTSRLLMISIGALIAVIALFGPYLYIQNKIDHRQQALRRAFPDTLDLLLICVESGLALDAAMNRVCTELGRAYPEMTEELNRTRLELALINDRVRALMNLGDRTNMVQFRSLVAALIQSERFGTSLTDTMRVLSEDFRLQRLSDAEAKAARLPVLLTIPLIFLLMPAFILIVMGPAIVRFARESW